MNKKPTKVLEAAGAFKKNPRRGEDRQGEPREIEELKPGVGIPDEIKARGLEDLWNRILSVAHKGSVATADQFMLVTATLLYNKMLTEFETMKSSDIQALVKCLGELGLSPIQRTRLNVKPKPTGNRFDDL